MRRLMAVALLLASVSACDQEQAATAPRLLLAQDLPVDVEPAALQRQYDSLLRMKLERLEYSTLGPISLIAGQTGLTLPPDAAERKEGDFAGDILLLVGDILLATGDEVLRVKRNSFVDPSCMHALVLSESINGLPVVNGGVSIGYHPLTKNVSSVTAIFVPDRDLIRSPRVSAMEAEAVVRDAPAKADTRVSEIEIMEGTYLGYFANASRVAPTELVWAIEASLPDGSFEMIYVSAVTGAEIARMRLSRNFTD